jgi:hypothetical protein
VRRVSGPAVFVVWIALNYALAALLMYRAERTRGATKAEARSAAISWPLEMFGGRTA